MKAFLSKTSLVALSACFMFVGTPLPVNSAQSNAAGNGSTATNSDDPIAYYRAYETAIAAGDVAAAQVAAGSAWRTGERVWAGNNPNLAGLAFNAAWSLGLAGKIGDAREPARRAVELAARYPDKVKMSEAQFLAAYAELVNTPTKRNLDRFQAAASGVGNGGWGDYLLPRAYVDAARFAISLDAPRLGRQMVDLGLVEADRLAPNNTNLRTSLMILRTQSSMKLRQYGQAVNEAMDARRAYGPKKLDRDVNWATLAAWESASRAVYQSIYDIGPVTGSRIPSREDVAKEWGEEEAKLLNASPTVCDNEGIKRTGSTGPAGISFPQQAVDDGYAGGAIVRASLDAQGNVVSTDILASLPRPNFGTAAADGIKGWKYDVPANIDAACRFVDVQLIYAFAR
jgi:hypothetical protein